MKSLEIASVTAAGYFIATARLGLASAPRDFYRAYDAFWAIARGVRELHPNWTEPDLQIFWRAFAARTIRNVRRAGVKLPLRPSYSAVTVADLD